MQIVSTTAWIAALLSMFVPAAGQSQSKAPQFNHVTITMKTEGGPNMCMAGVRYCLPTYFALVDEKGNVKYVGIGGVRIEGEKTHSVSSDTVRELVAEFIRIKFFSLDDEYRVKRLPDGTSVTIDHTNATTISIDLDGKQKSIYIFFGEPDELKQLQHKLFDALQISQYVGGITNRWTRGRDASGCFVTNWSRDA